jgi:hypothetical protein
MEIFSYISFFNNFFYIYIYIYIYFFFQHEGHDELDGTKSQKTQGKRKPAYAGGLVLEPKKGLNQVYKGRVTQFYFLSNHYCFV